jgi:signal transduction histidine kinase
VRVALVLAAVALGIGTEWAAYESGELGRSVADLLTGWVLLGCGGAAATRRGGGRVGALMAAAGAAWLVGSLAPAALYLHRGPLVQLLLSYPSGRVSRRAAKVVIAAAYLDAAIEPLGRRPVPTLMLCAATAGVALAGYVAETGPRRRARLVPTLGAAALGLVLGITAVAQLADRGGEGVTLAAYEGVLMAIALALLADLRRERWSQGAVTGLVVELGELWEPVTLRDRLARALGDPSLQLGYWLGAGRGYADEEGRPLLVPEAGGERGVTPVDADGEPVAVLLHDRTVLEDPALVEGVAAAARIAVANVRLQAEVRARVEQLAASRRRIVEAADAQRRRLQGELHDGAEARLAAVSAHVEALAADVDEEQARQLLADVEAQVRAAQAELSELARGIHPPALTAGGLASALPELAGRAPVPVDVRVAGARSPAAVEAAAYFVCAEALANVSKYARASRVTVDVERRDGRLAVAVADDGVGGADPDRGTGLRGLADRVEALGGTFELQCSSTTGTLVRARMPLC